MNQPDIIINCVTCEKWQDYLSRQNMFVKNWLKHIAFRPEKLRWVFVPSPKGALDQVVFILPEHNSTFSLGILVNELPDGRYTLKSWDPEIVETELALGWFLGRYRFDQYKKYHKNEVILNLPEIDGVIREAETVNWVRDLINKPAQDLGPDELAQASLQMVRSFGGSGSQIIGDKLLMDNFQAIYAVGKACSPPRAPRLIDLCWGNPEHPKVTLVGKGVCFDTGGLDLKPSKAMRLMKKDMGGAAHVLGLARRIMEEELPIYLRVLIPAVENGIGSKAFRPGDILTMRSGLTVEVDNTDAEGRLILADALSFASEDNPDLLIDFSTLTGAARIALGTMIPVMFARNADDVSYLQKTAWNIEDPVWQLPLYTGYRSLLDSDFADMLNSSETPYGGAITAALFLDRFVAVHIPWIHFDVMAWNEKNLPGRPQGGEAMGLRAVYAWLVHRYG